MSKEVDSRVVVVTGASAGVGRAVAREFGARGCRVGLLARGRERLEAAKRDIENAGGKPLFSRRMSLTPKRSKRPPIKWSRSWARSTSGSTMQ